MRSSNRKRLALCANVSRFDSRHTANLAWWLGKINDLDKGTKPLSIHELHQQPLFGPALLAWMAAPLRTVRVVLPR
jgi:hypothetical protein